MEAPASRDLNSGLIIKAGWLHVHMETTFCCCTWGAWEKRYVVIRNNTVFIFSGETATVPLRQFSLYGATCAADVSTTKAMIYLTASSQGKLDIQAKSAEECREWALALQMCAIKASGGHITNNPATLQRAGSGADRAYGST